MKIKFTEINTETYDSIAAFDEMHPNAEILGIDGHAIDGFCDHCAKPVRAGSNAGIDCVLHKRCAKGKQ